jgi:PAT family beta-lactamase induction signal transducer AmpG
LNYFVYQGSYLFSQSEYMTNKPTSVSPWVYIPTLYFAEGIPYMIINSVSVIFYKKLGVDNTQIAFWTSLISFPWILKMFWSPFILPKENGC